MPDTTPTRRIIRARDVTLRGKAAEEARALEAEMAAHRPAYDAYVDARTRSGDREPHRLGYTAYKRAYGRLRAIRRAAWERQHG